jgi:metal-responsive CopG/Arc/MetJ family transcriptional regulator
MKIKINVAIAEGIVEEVDRLAGAYGLSRSQMVQNLLSVSLSEAKLFKAIGLLDLALMVEKVQKHLKLNLETR